MAEPAARKKVTIPMLMEKKNESALRAFTWRKTREKVCTMWIRPIHLSI